MKRYLFLVVLIIICLSNINAKAEDLTHWLTPSVTPTQTVTQTFTITPSSTATATATSTTTITSSPSPSPSPSATITPTGTVKPSETPTITPSVTGTEYVATKTPKHPKDEMLPQTGYFEDTVIMGGLALLCIGLIVLVRILRKKMV